LEPALNAVRIAVRRNRGIVSKEGGDGLIALFGAPMPTITMPSWRVTPRSSWFAASSF